MIISIVFTIKSPLVIVGDNTPPLMLIYVGRCSAMRALLVSR